ncbi:MAG: hypothetical protein ACXVBW_00890 [Bdellovibrionota bacterium]
MALWIAPIRAHAEDPAPSPTPEATTEPAAAETPEPEPEKKEKKKKQEEETPTPSPSPSLAPGKTWWNSRTTLDSQAANDWGFHGLAMGMPLGNSAEQGGAGPGGVTVLSQFEAGVHWRYVGAGVFGQIDRQGSNETDIQVGPKIEARFMILFAEGGFAPLLWRNFTDRSIASQRGFAWHATIGVRFPVKISFLPKLPDSQGFFMEGCYTFRIMYIMTQDGTNLSDPIIQRDAYPIFGMGYRF